MHYIVMRLIMDLFKNKVQRPGGWVDRRWREKEGIYLAGMRVQAVEAADGEDER